MHLRVSRLQSRGRCLVSQITALTNKEESNSHAVLLFSLFALPSPRPNTILVWGVAFTPTLSILMQSFLQRFPAINVPDQP